jgi:serine/threonine protein kinase
MIGQVVGQYKIVEKLGEGGMGAVYKGVDLMIEREVAIKMLRPEIARQPELVERFRAEAVTLAKLNYPGIAILYSFFRQGDDFFMVMEYVAGRTLDSIIRESGAMAWDRAVTLFCRILEAIQPAHQAGILHRDIKPSNIMLTNWGGVKVMDFGIARVLGSARMTREGRMVGTIEYIAPERIKGNEADARADIYSLGVVLYEMLTGHLPFESTSEYEIMRGHVQDPPPPFTKFGPNVPESIETVVMMSLAKSVDQRIQSCSAFLMALQNATQGLMPGRDSGVYATAETIHSQSSATSDIHIPAMGPQQTGFTPTESMTMPGAAVAGEPKATRFEPAPRQFAPPSAPPQFAQPPVPLIQMPPGSTTPAASRSGLLAQLNWKHYSAAAAVLVVICVLAALLSAGKPKAATAEEEPVVTTAPAVVTQTPSSVPPAPDVIPTTSPAVQPQIPVSELDTSNKDFTPLTTGGSDDLDAKEQAARAARAREAARQSAKKKADALKALEEQ